MLKTRGQYPIAVATTLEGRYIVDGKNWIPISITASDEDIKKIYEDSTVKPLNITLKLISPPENDLPKRQWEIKSKSIDNKIYIVRFWGFSDWSCDCLGYSFRRTCKHIDTCQLILREEK
jgi:hypothetical protein